MTVSLQGDGFSYDDGAGGRVVLTSLDAGSVTGIGYAHGLAASGTSFGSVVETVKCERLPENGST